MKDTCLEIFIFNVVTNTQNIGVYIERVLLFEYLFFRGWVEYQGFVKTNSNVEEECI